MYLSVYHLLSLIAYKAATCHIFFIKCAVRKEKCILIANIKKTMKGEKEDIGSRPIIPTYI